MDRSQRADPVLMDVVTPTTSARVRMGRNRNCNLHECSKEPDVLRHESSLEEFEPDLRNALESVAKQLPAQDLRDVEEYLDYGEYGVAYELLIFLLDKQQLAWPVTLKEAGMQMGFAD